jgi:tight adherence protein B
MDAVTFLMIAVALGVALAFGAITSLALEGFTKYRQSFTQQVRFNFAELFLFLDPVKLFAVNIALIFVGGAVLYLVTGNLLLVIVYAVVLLLAPRILYAQIKKRRLHKLTHQLPDSLLMLSGALRAGSSLQQGISRLIEEVGPPLAQEFELFWREQRLGLPVDQALVNMQNRVPVEDFILVVSAMRIAREVGGNLAETLERLAETLRQKQMIEGKIRSLTAQGKLQGLIVGALPILLGIILTQMEPESMAPLTTTWYGWAVIAAVIVLEVLGYYFIRKIVSIDV